MYLSYYLDTVITKNYLIFEISIFFLKGEVKILTEKWTISIKSIISKLIEVRKLILLKKLNSLINSINVLIRLSPIYNLINTKEGFIYDFDCELEIIPAQFLIENKGKEYYKDNQNNLTSNLSKKVEMNNYNDKIGEIGIILEHITKKELFDLIDIEERKIRIKNMDKINTHSQFDDKKKVDNNKETQATNNALDLKDLDILNKKTSNSNENDYNKEIMLINMQNSFNNNVKKKYIREVMHKSYKEYIKDYLPTKINQNVINVFSKDSISTTSNLHKSKLYQISHDFQKMKSSIRVDLEKEVKEDEYNYEEYIIDTTNFMKYVDDEEYFNQNKIISCFNNDKISSILRKYQNLKSSLNTDSSNRIINRINKVSNYYSNNNCYNNRQKKRILSIDYSYFKNNNEYCNNQNNEEDYFFSDKNNDNINLGEEANSFKINPEERSNIKTINFLNVARNGIKSLRKKSSDFITKSIQKIN